MSETQLDPNAVNDSQGTAIVVRGELSPAERAFELDQRRAKAYADSGYFSDAKKLSQALVKIELARELEIARFEAMSDLHIIEGKPELGAGILSKLVKRSGIYDFRVRVHDNERCEIAFLDVRTGEPLGVSVFTMEDAKRAELASRPMWKKYPRNMLFARAMSNGVAWFCPDAVAVRVYVEGEISGVEDVGVARTPASALDAPPTDPRGGESSLLPGDDDPAPASGLPPQEQQLVDQAKAEFDAREVNEPDETRLGRLDTLVVQAIEHGALSILDVWFEVAGYRRQSLDAMVAELGEPDAWQPLRTTLRPDEISDLTIHLAGVLREAGLEDDIPF